MALQSSGAISLLQIAGEFGGAAPHSMSEYRGDGGTPATGPISFSDFYGTSSFSILLTNQTISAVRFNATATASARTLTSGELQRILNGAASNISGQYGSPPAANVGAGYEIRLTRTAGVNTTGSSLGVWLNMGTTRTWTITRTTVGTTSFTGTAEIRPVGGAVIDTASWIIRAEKTQ